MSDKPESKCPVSGKSVEGSACPMRDATTGQVTVSRGCPVSPRNIYKFFTGIDSEQTKAADGTPQQYNVYSEKIDPLNRMPVNPANNCPRADQAIALDTNRQKSNIPKGGTDSDTWVYPSPQMFWNSLNRKNKVDGAKEEDMDVVVSVHNNMNEKTWNEVMKWEQLKSNGAFIGGPPKLLRFEGRPFDLSIKARLKSFFGHPAPFDRHDWYIDQGGRVNRYIIDYYHDISSSSKDLRPSDNLTDFAAMKSIQVDVRPTFDNFFGVYSRLFVMPFKRLVNMTNFTPLPFFAPKKMISGEAEAKAQLSQQFTDIQSKCVEAKNKLQNCQSEEECGAAAVGLQRCTASVVCPDIAKAFDAAIAASNVANAGQDKEDAIQHSFKKMSDCLESFEVHARSLK